MTKFAKIENDDSLKRDMETGVLIGTSVELEAYRKKKAKILQERDRDRQLKEVQNELKDIRQLLGELLSKF